MFVVADSDDKLDDYDFTVYTGVKNVPDIEGKTGATVDVAADKDGVAKVVYVQDADVSGAGTVYFAHADKDAKLVKDSEVGNYFEIDAVVNNEVVTLKVKEGSTAADRLIENIGSYGVQLSSTERIIALDSITENADGLVTSVSRYDVESGDGDGFITGTGTGKAENETVKLNSANKRFAWDDEKVVVVRYDYKGDFSTSRISSIKDDSDDNYVAVLDSNVITGICIVEKDGQSGGGGSSQGANWEAEVTEVNEKNGRFTVDFTYERPEYVPVDVPVTLTFAMYEDGYQTLTGLTVTIPAGKTTATYKSPMSTVVDPETKVEAKVTAEAPAAVSIRYYNGSTEVKPADLFKANSYKTTVAVGTSSSIGYTLDTTATTGASVKVMQGTTELKANTSIGNASTAQTISSLNVAGTNYVDVIFTGLDSLKETYTFKTDLTSSETLEAFGVTASNDKTKTLEIKTVPSLSNNDPITEGNTYQLKITIGAISDVVSYRVKIAALGVDTVMEANDVYTKNFTVSGNITLNKADVKVTTEVEKLAVKGTPVWTDKAVTIQFNNPVTAATAVAANIEAVDAGTTSAFTNYDVSWSSDRTSVTVTLLGADTFAAGDTVKVKTAALADENGNQIATATVLATKA